MRSSEIGATARHHPAITTARVLMLCSAAFTAHVNDRSYLYSYDPLARLSSADLGQLNATNSAIEPVFGKLTRHLGWALDDLGNWTGDAQSPGFFRGGDTTGDGLPDDTLELTHAVDPANEITTVTTEVSGDPNGPAEQLVVYDRAGNLTWDGQLFYQFDGSNRLVQVNVANELEAADFDLLVPDPCCPGEVMRGSCKLLPASGDKLGPALAHFVYDGLGRLIETTRYDQQGNSQTAEYYYDGVRRIGEIETTYLYNPADPNNPTVSTATREYIWGPDYVDEVVALIEDTGAGPITYYYLQDANYNVVAVLGSVGGTGGMGVSPVILRQYTYEPYGAVVFADENGAAGLPPLPNNRLGHQGLFFERLYVDPNDSLLEPALTPGAAGLYYMRNRWLDPRFGRPLQRDMNESALLVLGAMAMNGQALGTAISGFDAQSHYGDGMNLYQYVGSNPVKRRDPRGLFSIIEISGSTGYELDSNYDSLDMGMTLLGAIRGFADAIETRNMTLEQLTGAASTLDFRSTDRLLAAYEIYQTGQAAFFAVGVLRAGAEFTKSGVLSFYKRTRGGHHGIPKFMGGGRLQHLYDVPIEIQRRFHRSLDTALQAQGFPAMTSRKWEEFMREYPERQEEAFEIVRRVAMRHDAENGTDFLLSFNVSLLNGDVDAW